MKYRNTRLLIFGSDMSLYYTKSTAMAMPPYNAPSISVLSEANTFPLCKHYIFRIIILAKTVFVAQQYIAVAFSLIALAGKL